MTTVTHGPTRHQSWGRSLKASFRWQLTSMRLVLPVMVVLQILVAAALSIGISLFHAELTPGVSAYLATGTATIVLVLVGLVVGPQIVAGDKEAGTYDYGRSLPIRDTVRLASWLLTCAMVSIPSTVVALLVASWQLDVAYDMTWHVVPAMSVVLVTGALLGYAIAHAIERPMAIQLVSQLMAFAVLGFTPITYPLSNLPNWLAAAQRGLPFYHMGAVVRDGLLSGVEEGVHVSYVVIMVWLLLAIVVASRALRRSK